MIDQDEIVQLSEIEVILERLISFDTTSHKSNLALIDYIKGYLDSHSVAYKLVPNEDGDKSSLFASIGPQIEGGIGLSGHTDVVPVEGQIWDTDPFKLSRKEDKLYGRGTTDMKGFLAVMLAAVPLFKRCDLNKPVHLIFSYDEEIGCTGVRPLIDLLGNSLPLPDFVMVGEPSNSKIVEAHKGITSFETKITGFEAHSSQLDQGVSAITIAAQLISFLHNKQKEIETEQNDPRYSPPYSTIHVGKVAGGTARNIIAKACTFLWEVRSLNSYDALQAMKDMMAYADAHLLPEMHKISANCSIETTVKGAVPGLSASPEAVELGYKLAKQNSSSAVSYGTEAGLFELGGAPTIICGPGSIDQAHKPNEFIERKELLDCLEIMKNIVQHLKI